MLAGEMILTFYKPTALPNAGRVREPSAKYFTELLDDVLRAESAEEMTSQYLFNKLILRAWFGHSLSQLAVKREIFVEELQKRGWQYDPRRHTWRRGKSRNEELPLGMS